MKPYRLSGFQNSGENIRNRFAEADRLEAGSLNPLGGKSKLSIELAFHFFSPFTRIRTGRWSQIHEGQWYPYGKTKRRSGYTICEGVEGPAAECLELAKRKVDSKLDSTDYWFPTEGKADEPIKNVDRTWKKICEKNDWPDISLGLASKYFNQTYYWRNLSQWMDSPLADNSVKFVHDFPTTKKNV